MLVDSNRIQESDKKFDEDIVDGKFGNRLFLRLTAKRRLFTRVDFRHTVFDTCYLRNCIFDSCDFTGCRFIRTNMVGSSFSGCIFSYSYFERTVVDSDVMSSGCPGEPNLKMRFARALRMNYQQLGDAKSANMAIGVELDATNEHLYKGWRSNESYYRKKYKGWDRVKFFFEWLEFKALDLVWGNGESTIKLFRAVLVFLVFMSIVDARTFKDPQLVSSYWKAFVESIEILLGTLSPNYYPTSFLAFVAFVRLVVFGFFMSIIIKRFNRR